MDYFHMKRQRSVIWYKRSLDLLGRIQDQGYSEINTLLPYFAYLSFIFIFKTLSNVQSYLQQLLHSLDWYHCLTPMNADRSWKSVLNRCQQETHYHFWWPIWEAVPNMQPLSSCIFPQHASTGKTSLFKHVRQHVWFLICENYPSKRSPGYLVKRVFDKLTQKRCNVFL